MSIATEKLKAASNRFQLVKITPARYVGGDLVLDSGNYTMEFPFSHIEKVERNGSELTLVTSLTSNDQYTWDGTDLTLKIASAPDEDTNIIVVFYNLYYTGEKHRFIPKDPESAESAGNPLVEWEPRLNKYIDTSQTIRNITAGILTIADTSLDILNPDDEFQQYLTANDSFNNKDVEIWQCISDISNIQKIYRGQVKSLPNIKGKVRINIFDPFTKLQQSSYMGDSFYQAVARREASGYPNLYPDMHNKAVPYIFGVSPNEISRYYKGGSPNQYLWRKYLYEGLQAKDIDYVAEGGVTDNRDYVLCRVGPSGLRYQDFGSTTRSVQRNTTDTLFYLTNHNLMVGDVVKYTDTGGNAYARVVLAEDVTYLGNTYNIVISRYTAYSADPVPTSTASFTPMKQILLVMQGLDSIGVENFWRFIPEVHFSFTETTTAGGNKLVKVTLIDNLESHLSSWSGTIRPEDYDIFYRVANADEYDHAEGLKLICEKAGLDTNAASFTAASAALDAELLMTIPRFDRDEYRSYRDVVQTILQSTLSYLKINTDLEVEYHLLDAPSSGDTSNDKLFLTNSLSIKTDYNDIITGINANNPQVTAYIGADETAPETDSVVFNSKAKRLHGIENDIVFEHVLNSIDDRIEDILASRSNRRAIYSLSTATEHIDSEIGDDITLQDDSVLGTSDTVNLKITSIKKDGKSVKLTAEDLEGL